RCDAAAARDQEWQNEKYRCGTNDWGAEIILHARPRFHSLVALTLLLAARGCRAISVLGDASRPGGDLPAIRELHGRASRQMRAIFGAKTLDRNHVARLQRVFSPAL